MIRFQVEDATVEIEGREVTIMRNGFTVSAKLSAEDALGVIMCLAGTFPPPPGLCGSGPNSCEGCTC